MRYKDDSLALHTDLYQINMAQAYWKDGIHNRKAVFEAFFRKIPFGNGYAIFAGLERIVDYLNHFHFTEEDIAYLRSTGHYSEDFCGTCRKCASPEHCAPSAKGSSFLATNR